MTIRIAFCALFVVCASGLYAAVELPFQVNLAEDFERYRNQQDVRIVGLKAEELAQLRVLRNARTVSFWSSELDQRAFFALAALPELQQVVFLSCKGDSWSDIALLRDAPKLCLLNFGTRTAHPLPDPEDQAGLVKGIAKLTQLRSLSLHAAPYSELTTEVQELRNLTSLTSLWISALDSDTTRLAPPYLEDRKGVWAFLGALEALEEVDLFPGGYSTEFLREVSALPRLKKLRVGSPARLSTESQFEFKEFVTPEDVSKLTTIRTLEHLTIAGVPSDTSDDVITKLLALPRLRYLDLGYWGKVTGSFLLHLHEATALEVLRLNNVRDAVEGLWENIKPSATLREFHVEFGGYDFLHKCLPALAKFPKLEVLDLHANRGIRQPEIFHLKQLIAEDGFPALRILKLYAVGASEDYAEAAATEIRDSRKDSLTEVVISRFGRS